MPTTQVLLKNGSTEENAAVVATMNTLHDLAKTNPILLYELYEVCTNPAHRLFGECGSDLVQYRLLQSNLKPHDTIRNVVLSSVVPKGLDFDIRDPRS